MLLRALVNLDPYTFTDDLVEEIADESEKRGTEEVLLSVIDGTADGKLSFFELSGLLLIALSGTLRSRQGSAELASGCKHSSFPPAGPFPMSSRTARVPNS